MSTKMNSKIYKIGDRVANASLNALSGCIVCKLGTVIAVDNGMIEIKNDWLSDIAYFFEIIFSL